MIAVVAVALINPDGRILMQKRRIGGAHGGLWEFPGGKLEPGESEVSALIREIEEELAIILQPEAPHYFARACSVEDSVVMSLYTCRQWLGDVRCLQGEAVGWYLPGELPELAMPPVDIPLANALATELQRAK